ncbi:MEDS domain-containing protein [Actinoplanes sp. NPDC023714]|uniref:MEDS domain-containing protein n=1 Tax=Actinoplanes sp. NPDC023714 TaxID=3154322 RepID=UPI003406A6FE
MTSTRIFERLQPGDHVCVVVDDDAQQARGVAGYIRAGLRQRQRVVFYGDHSDLLERELVAHGVDSAAASAAGRLKIVAPHRSYLASGRFEPEATIEAWRVESAAAEADGYHGLRVGGDMSWASRPLPGADRLSWYEGQVNRVFADGFITAACFYDRGLFTPAFLREVAGAHPGSTGAGSGEDLAPQLRMIRTVDPPGLRLEGEADLVNRAALRAVMRSLAEDTPDDGRPLTVDVSGLRYADASAARTLLHPALVSGRRVRLTGCSRVLRRVLAFQGAGSVPAFTIEAASQDAAAAFEEARP